MKKSIAILLAAALSLSLAGCGQGGTHQTETAPDEMAVSAPQQEASIAAGLRLASQSSQTGFAGISTFLSSEANGTIRQRLMYVDYAAAAESLPCADPACTHETDSCTAVVPKTGVWCGEIAAIDDDTILYVQRTLDRSKGGVYTMRKDGTEFKTLTETGPGIDIFGVAALDETSVYLACNLFDENQESIRKYIGRVPLAGGELQEVGELEAGCSWIGTEQRGLILQQQNDEKGMAFISMNLDTGETTPLFTWKAKAPDYAGLAQKQGDKIYGFIDTVDSLHWSSLDGSDGDIPIQWPQEMNWPKQLAADLELVTPDAASVVLYDPEHNIGKRYTITLADGSVKENPLTMANSSDLVNLVGSNQDTVLIELLHQEEWTETVGEDGTPQDKLNIISRLAVMPLQSFLAGSTDYIEVRSLVEGEQES